MQSGSSLASPCQRGNHRRQRRRIHCARDPHPCSRCELDVDRLKADKTTSRRSLAGNLHRRKTGRCRRAHLPSPAKELTWMNPGLSGYCRHTGSRFQRCCDQLLLLRETPAPPPLNRCDDLNLPIRHVIIPVNTHITHTLTKAARRPLSEGYSSSVGPAASSRRPLPRPCPAHGAPRPRWPPPSSPAAAGSPCRNVPSSCARSANVRPAPTEISCQSHRA